MTNPMPCSDNQNSWISDLNLLPEKLPENLLRSREDTDSTGYYVTVLDHIGETIVLNNVVRMVDFYQETESKPMAWMRCGSGWPQNVEERSWKVIAWQEMPPAPAAFVPRMGTVLPPPPPAPAENVGRECDAAQCQTKCEAPSASADMTMPDNITDAELLCRLLHSGRISRVDLEEILAIAELERWLE